MIKAAFPEKTDRLLGKYSKTKDIFTKNYSIETAHYYLKKEDLKRAAFFHAIGKIFNLYVVQLYEILIYLYSNELHFYV